jgi:hypothetical protein
MCETVLQLKSTSAGMRSDCSAPPRMLFQQFGSASCATESRKPDKGRLPVELYARFREMSRFA